MSFSTCNQPNLFGHKKLEKINRPVKRVGTCNDDDFLKGWRKSGRRVQEDGSTYSESPWPSLANSLEKRLPSYPEGSLAHDICDGNARAHGFNSMPNQKVIQVLGVSLNQKFPFLLSRVETYTRGETLDSTQLPCQTTCLFLTCYCSVSEFSKLFERIHLTQVYDRSQVLSVLLKTYWDLI